MTSTDDPQRALARAVERLTDLIETRLVPALERWGAVLEGAVSPRVDEQVVSALLAQLDAARSVNDAERVIALRDELAAALPVERRRALDRELVVWLMTRVRRGLANVPIGVEVVELVTKMASRFAETAEGASLHRALPVLRRSVGLCPRCAQPYVGEDDACPACLGALSPEPLRDPEADALARPRPSVLEEAGLEGGNDDSDGRPGPDPSSPT